MRRHRRRNKKQRNIIIISVCSLLLIMTVGYAAMQTNLSINTKGNIIKKASAGSDLIELAGIVTSGDGLYADTYEEGRYIYKGANPNNYITFSGETWRIISVESDNTIKIMRNESIGNIAFDSTNSNNWAKPATLNTHLNDTYLLTLSNSDKVVSHNYSIGAVTWDNNDLADQINDENGTTWNSKVGLITVSEYLRANTNTAQCETNMLNNDNRETCLTTNWMHSAVPTNGYMWTISPSDSYTYRVFYVIGHGARGNGALSYYSATDSYGVVPVLYLSSDITLQGEGTSQTPYTLG